MTCTKLSCSSSESFSKMQAEDLSFLSTLTAMVSSILSGPRTIPADLSFSRSGNPGWREVPPQRDPRRCWAGFRPRARERGARGGFARGCARAPASPPSPASVLRAFFVNEAPLRAAVAFAAGAGAQRSSEPTGLETRAQGRRRAARCTSQVRGSPRLAASRASRTRCSIRPRGGDRGAARPTLAAPWEPPCNPGTRAPEAAAPLSPPPTEAGRASSSHLPPPSDSRAMARDAR